MEVFQGGGSPVCVRHKWFEGAGQQGSDGTKVPQSPASLIHPRQRLQLSELQLI